MTIITKRQVVKVYSQNGTFIDVWRDAPLLGLDGNTQAPKFAVNTVTGQATINLPRPFDNFDEGGDSRGRGGVTAGNVVQVWVFDNATLTAGRMVFQGYIDGYIPQIGTDGSEYVQVLISPFDTVLGDVKFIGTQNFGVAGSSTTYVDTVQMFNWPFGQVIAAVMPGVISPPSSIYGGITTTIPLSNLNNILPGSTLYLQGTGVYAGTSDGPLTVASSNPSTNEVTFTVAPTNNYNIPPHVPAEIIVAGLPPLYSTTTTTGGVTTSIVINATTNLAVGMIVGIVSDTLSESATIKSIVGTTITFTAPLQNSYTDTIGICPPLSFNTITNRPYTYPLTLDPGNPTSSGYLNQAQLHNQSFVDWFEAIRNTSPLNWYWVVTPQKTVIFKPAPTTAQHIFTVGKDINQPQYQKDFTNLRNDIYVKGTGVTARATGSDMAIYGQRTEVIVEPRIVDANTAQRYANAVLAQLDKVDYRATLTIVDSRGDISGLGYDIETVSVGDSCRIENPGYNSAGTLWDQFVWDVDVWDHATSQLDQVVTISALTYQFDTLELELSSLQPSQDKYLVNLARQFESSQFN